MIAWFFAVAAGLGAATIFIKNKAFNYISLSVFNVLLCLLTYYEYYHLNQAEYRLFRADSLSFVFLLVLNIISITSTVQTLIYEYRRNDPPDKMSFHNGSMILFITVLAGVYLATHAGAQWALLEATTLIAAMLINHERNNHSLEAAWKYIFVCSMGIGLAFAGILFLTLAANRVGLHELNFESIALHSSKMDPVWLTISFVFVLVGYSAKAGVAPFFTIDIDAKDASPSAVGALFSSALANAGFLTVYRFYAAYAGAGIVSKMHLAMFVTAGVSMLFATVYIVKTKNYKRMLAYSSTEHAGLAMLGFSLGAPGIPSAFYHLITHGFIKAALFYQVGKIHRMYLSKEIRHVRGFFHYSRPGAVVVLVGIAFLTAMPPSGLFISEMGVFRALWSEGRVWQAIPVFFLLTVVVYQLFRKVLPMLFASPPTAFVPYEKTSVRENIMPALLLLIAALLGVYPPHFLMEFIQQAVNRLPL